LFEVDVDAVPEPDEAFALPLVVDDAVDPCAEPVSEELALDPSPVAAELFDPEVEADPEPDVPAVAVPLVPDDAVDPCAVPEPEEPVLDPSPVAVELFEPEVEADPEPDVPPVAVPLVPVDALDP
jgi:hypothetical protein